MKLKTLKITGINSFNEEQIIDFSKLISGGIFGIFGDTGSGKSTIIDCITLALYGRIVRHKNKSKNGDFINLNRNNAKVEFEFSIKEGNQRKNFSILRQFKRDKKGNINSDIVRLIDLDKQEIISDKKSEIDICIKNIIGLNYDDFTKAVVLPQGKFSEFLMLENKEKRKMLERIFGLEKYGGKLTEKINKNKNEKQKEVEYIKEKIGIYENITPEIIAEKKNILKEEQNILMEKEEQEKNILKEEQFFKENKKFKEEHIFYNNEFEKLLPYENMVKKMIDELENSKKANIIKPFILEIEKIREKKVNLEEEYLNLEEEYLSLEEEYTVYYEKYEEISKIYKDEIPILEKTKVQLENCIKWEKEYKDIKTNIEKIENLILEKNNNKKVFEENYDEILKSKELIKSSIKKLEEFKEKNKIDSFFKENIEKGISILKDIENVDKKIISNNEKISDYKNLILENKQKIEENKKESEKISNIIKNILISNKINLEKSLSNIKEKIEQNNFNIENIKKEINILENQIKLQENKEFTKELTEKLKIGEECPICGSKEHPNPAKIFFDFILENLTEKKENLFNDIEKTKEENNILFKEEITIKKYIDDIILKLQEYNLVEIKDKFEEKYILNNDEIFKIIDKYNKKIAIINENKINYTAKLENLNELIKDLEKENKSLLEEKEKLNLTQEKIKQNFNIKDFNYENEKLIKIQNENILKDEQLTNLRKDLENILQNEDKIKIEISEIEKIILYSKSSLEEKESQLKAIEKNINESGYKKDFEKFFNEVKEKISKIEKEEEEIKFLYVKVSKKRDNIKIQFENTKTKIEINGKENEEKSDKLQNMLIKNNILEEDVSKMALNKNDEEYRENKIASYKEKRAKCEINLERISKEFFEKNKKNIEEINIENITEKLNKILEEKSQIENIKNDKISNIAKLKYEIEEGEKALKITGELQKELKEKLKKLDILEELAKITKGELFVEYVANSQLKYVVLDASKRLEFMSQNKYSLELIDNEFCIKDHFNAGIIRSSRSLSGGEVFMASLSLALALSNKIQLKNKAPLEVFFLDEGFGTLDTNILDTVINTLEQLQSDNIDVGIITHIEEIKNRVQNKILIKNGVNNISGATITLE